MRTLALIAAAAGAAAAPARPMVVAYTNDDQQAPTYWLDYDWSILTHIIAYGWRDPNMVYYAKARGVKMLLPFAGMSRQDATNATVRAAQVKSILRMAPPPYGPAQFNQTFDGMHFDIECTEQPCPWLGAGQPAGMALFFQELKAAWPTCVISLYVSGNGGVRLNRDPNGDQRTYPFEYAAKDVAAMAPSVDQVVYGGYASNNYTFLAANTIAPCEPDTSVPISGKSCGGFNPSQSIDYALNGAHGAAKPCQDNEYERAAWPCAVDSWSAVVPKEKLVYAVGWYNLQRNLKNSRSAHDPVLGGSPSFCATVHWKVAYEAKHGPIQKVLDESGTWVFDRVDDAGEAWRLWFDDERSLGPKYAMVRKAGWGGVGMWLADGMFPNGIHTDRPGYANTYCPDALRSMWKAVEQNFVQPAAAE